MDSKPDTKKLRMTKALICLHGKCGDIVIGNGESYNPMYVENGKSFLKLLDNIEKDGTSLLEQDLLELLCSQNILSKQHPNLQQPPVWADTCCGRIGEQTVILPLAEEAKDEVYENFLDYVLESMDNYSTLTIKFHGHDPMLHWHRIEKIIKLINRKKVEDKPDIQMKYHFDSSLDKLSEGILRWMKQNIVSFSVFSPLPEGLVDGNQRYDNIKENVKKLHQAYVKVCLITPVVSGNIHKLQHIAEHYASFKIPCGFEFPAIQNPNHPWEYGNEKDLPDADEYSQVLVNIYRKRCIEDYLFSPVNELRHRVTNGGYCASCSCLYNNVTTLKANGNIYPCLKALNLDRLCIGNVTKEPENRLKHVSSEFENIQEESWGTRTKWPWRGLCDLYCPLLDNFMSGEGKKNQTSILEEYFYKPRVRLLSEIIWDIVKENK